MLKQCFHLCCPFYPKLNGNLQTQDVPGEDAVGGLQESIHVATQGVADLCFEEEEDEDGYYTKDLPEHACK